MLILALYVTDGKCTIIETICINAFRFITYKKYSVLPDFNIYRKELKYFFALVIDTATYMVNVIVVKCVSHAHAFERVNFKLLAQKRILLLFINKAN